MNYVLIGDIHSQANKLRESLIFIKKNIQNARVVFLGDIFDSKNSYSDSYSVYNLIKEAEHELNAITIQSNHQDKLIRYFKGNKVELSKGLDKTISDFNQCGVPFMDIYNWLIHQAYGIVFRDKFGIEFRCAHAYFSSDIQIQDYKEHYLVKAITPIHKHEFLYGIQDSEKNRINWWEMDNTNNSYVRASGHYQTIYTNLDNKSLVLDSRCGDLNGKLSIFDVNSRTIHQF